MKNNDTTAAFRNLPSMDMTKEENVQSAAKSEAQGTGVSGKYQMEIVQASLDQSKNGSVFLTLAFKMPNGKVYRQDAKHIMGADGKDGFYVPRLRAIFGITGAADTIGTTTIKGGDFIDGSWVERDIEVPSYVDLLGKKIGAVLHFYQKYPESLGINGYTGRPIPTKSEDEEGYNIAKNEASTIWMPNYDKDPQPVFDFISFYDPATEKTFAEMLDDNLEKPVAVEEALEKTLKKSHKAVVLEGKDWDALRIKRLKASLKKVGQQFDKNLFVPSESSSVNDTVDENDIP
jgi:hypothetical protein